MMGKLYTYVFGCSQLEAHGSSQEAVTAHLWSSGDVVPLFFQRMQKSGPQGSGLLPVCERVAGVRIKMPTQCSGEAGCRKVSFFCSYCVIDTLLCI